MKEALHYGSPMELQPEQIQPAITQNMDPMQAERLRGDVGAVNVAEIASVTYDAASFAYHSLSGVVRYMRAGFAQEREHKMDHKDLLYDHLGLDAVGVASGHTEQRLDKKGMPIVDASGGHVIEEPKHRSRAERFMAKRLEKKAFDKEYEDARRAFALKAYGGSQSNTLGWGTRIDTRKRTRAATAEFNSGNITARELTIAKTQIEGTPTGFENIAQRKTRKGVKAATGELDTAIRQPMLSRWRSRRRYEARKDKAHHITKAQKHQAKTAAIRTKRGW